MNDPALDRDTEEAAEPTELIARMRRLTSKRCVGCDSRICAHVAIFNIVLGTANAGRCLTCLARGLRQRPEELLRQLFAYVRHRDCYQKAWRIACHEEGTNDEWKPACLPSFSVPFDVDRVVPIETLGEVHADAAPIADRWNAGELGCGELVMQLRSRLNRLPPGSVLEVTALDPAAPLDLPAWCRLTGHRLVVADHPIYCIQRKEN